MTSIQPRIIKRSDPSRLELEWSDGARTVYSAAQLRALCPCARCVDELSGRRTHDPASVAPDLTQSQVELVGNYALSMGFSDGHNTGIFTFAMLRARDPATARAAAPGPDAHGSA